jgi:hypothetical protein
MLEVTLNSGRKVRLEQVYIAETYEGLMIKNPDKPWTRINQIHFTNDPVRTNKLWFNAPVTTLGSDHYRAHLEQQLPRLRFIARLASSTPAKDTKRMVSELVAVWFQDELHPILSPENLERLKAVNWDNLAQDFDIT